MLLGYFNHVKLFSGCTNSDLGFRRCRNMAAGAGDGDHDAV
jgi:hypothetical protein